MLMLSTNMTGFNHSFLRRNSLWLWYILETLSQKERMNRVRRRENFSSEEKKKRASKTWKAGAGQSMGQRHEREKR